MYRMPELPEVEFAVRLLRPLVVGETIARLELRHPALRRALAPASLRSLARARVTSVDRRGKHQLLALADGRTLVVHFRMTGDWRRLAHAERAGSAVRAVLHLANGVRLALHDPRALATITLHDAEALPIRALGPDATDPAVDAALLCRALDGKRTPIKLALLDQRVVAGLGNIYVAELLWRARVDPRTRAGDLQRAECGRVVRAMRTVLARAMRAPGRYASGEVASLDVYDREGEPCRRCRVRIARIIQGGRSTYYCPGCQCGARGARALSPSPPGSRP